MATLKTTIKRFSRKHTKYYHKFWDAIIDVWEWRPDWYYDVKHFVNNLPLFLKLAWRWRGWDYMYTLDVLCELLEAQGKLLKDGHLVSSRKRYKRCHAASGYIKKAYNGETDRSLSYLMKHNPCIFKNLGDTGYGELKINYAMDKKMYEGLWKIANDREIRVHAELKRHAWEYLHKYIEHFWD